MINQLVLFFWPFCVMIQDKPIHDLTEAEVQALIALIELEEPKRRSFVQIVCAIIGEQRVGRRRSARGAVAGT